MAQDGAQAPDLTALSPRSQLAALVNQVQLLTTKVTQLRAREQSGLAALPDLVRVLKDSSDRQVASQERASRQLVDARGLGKPTTFTGKEEDYQPWSTKVMSCVNAVYAGLDDVLEWACEQEQLIEEHDVLAQFGPGTLQAVDRVQEASAQLHMALLQLTTGESHNIVANSGKNGYEAW